MDFEMSAKRDIWFTTVDQYSIEKGAKERKKEYEHVYIEIQGTDRI